MNTTSSSSLKKRISAISANDQWEINPLTGMSKAEEGRAYKMYGEQLALMAKILEQKKNGNGNGNGNEKKNGNGNGNGNENGNENGKI